MSDVFGKIERSSEWVKQGAKNSRSEQARINGKRSGGPKSKEGKEKSSQNAVKHGLASEDFVLLEGEYPERYGRLHASFVDSYRPEGEHELSLVELITHLEWKCKRCCRLESKSIAGRTQLYGADEAYATTRPGFTENLLAYSRYLSNLRLNIRRAMKDLEDHQKKRKAEITERTQDSERGVAVSAAKAKLDESEDANNQHANNKQQNPKRTQATPFEVAHSA